MHRQPPPIGFVEDTAETRIEGLWDDHLIQKHDTQPSGPEPRHPVMQRLRVVEEQHIARLPTERIRMRRQDAPQQLLLLCGESSAQGGLSLGRGRWMAPMRKALQGVRQQ
eukprot:scaffold21350_cov118-Isochrysis_galbana.AAC.1